MVWIGWLIDTADQHFNDDRSAAGTRQLAGALASCAIIVGCVCVAVALTRALPDSHLGLLIEALVASSLIATHSLRTHVAAVHRCLNDADHRLVRVAPSALIVGRDTRHPR